MSDMTRAEEIRQEIDLQLAGSFGNYSEGYEEGFIEGAKWADETMIERAEKWLENFLEKTIQKPSVDEGFTSETIICADYKRRRLIRDVLCDFKKAMEL